MSREDRTPSPGAHDHDEQRLHPLTITGPLTATIQRTIGTSDRVVPIRSSGRSCGPAASVSDDDDVMLGPILQPGGHCPAVANWWSGEVSDSVTIVPDGGVDLIWTPGRRPWIAGPDTRPSASTVDRGSPVVGVRLATGAVSAIIGAPAGAIRDQRIDLDTVVSASTTRRVSELLHDVSTADAPKILATLAGNLVGSDWQPDPIVRREIHRIHSRGVFDAESSRRQVRRRFTDAMGYGPKLYERIVRVDRFARLTAEQPSISLAQAALLVGFHDQAHLSRDTRLLVGETPAVLARRSRCSGR